MQWRIVEQMILDQPPICCLIDDLIELGYVPKILRQWKSWLSVSCAPAVLFLIIPCLWTTLLLYSSHSSEIWLEAECIGALQAVEHLLTPFGDVGELPHAVQTLFNFPVQKWHL